MARKTYVLGKADYNGSGRRNCECTIEWELEDGRFAMSASVWNPRKTDIYMGGQCVAEVASYFPGDAKAQRMAAIWKRWHLNDMRAGSPAQEEHLRTTPDAFPGYPVSYYEWASGLLAKAGLNPDPNTGYRYGSAWLTEALPDDVIAEIESWE